MTAIVCVPASCAVEGYLRALLAAMPAAVPIFIFYVYRHFMLHEPGRLQSEPYQLALHQLQAAKETPIIEMLTELDDPEIHADGSDKNTAVETKP